MTAYADQSDQIAAEYRPEITDFFIQVCPQNKSNKETINLC